MDNGYIPTAEQVEGMRVEMAKRLTQWEAVYELALRHDTTWTGEASAIEEWPQGYVQGQEDLLDQLREVMGMASYNIRVQHWCAGWNLRGYSSDPETVFHGGTLVHAIDYLSGELGHAADYAADEEDAKAFSAALTATEEIDRAALEREAKRHGTYAGYWSVYAGDTEYWLMACFTEDCDQVDKEEG